MTKKKTRRRKGKPQSSLAPLALLGGLLLLIIAAAIVLNLPAAEQAVAPVTVSGRPSLEIDQERIDFGDVPVGQMVRASFKLSNAGDEPLVISYSPVAEVAEGC